MVSLACIQMHHINAMVVIAVLDNGTGNSFNFIGHTDNAKWVYLRNQTRVLSFLKRLPVSAKIFSDREKCSRIR